MVANRIRMITHRTRSIRDGGAAPTLPLLRHETSLAPADWLRESLRTFATSVASLLPGHFAAYARVHHPFMFGGNPPVMPGTWRELADRYRCDLRDAASAAAFAHNGVPDAQSHPGSLPLTVIDALVDHLAPATATPDECYFAVWDGFGGSAVPHDLEPRLALPYRDYHLFAGPVAAARTSFSSVSFHHQSANLWWPADHAWCVATEIDLSWTYVGGSCSRIDALLADARLDAAPTSATDLW